MNDKITYINSVNDLVDIVFPHGVTLRRIKTTHNPPKTDKVICCTYDKLNKVYRVGVV